MANYIFPRNSKSEKLAALICMNEDLALEWFEGDDILGDAIFDVEGDAEDIEVFKSVFEMIYF